MALDRVVKFNLGAGIKISYLFPMAVKLKF